MTSGTHTALVLLTGLLCLTTGQARDTGVQMPRWSPQARFLQVFAAVLASCKSNGIRGVQCVNFNSDLVSQSGEFSATTMLSLLL